MEKTPLSIFFLSLNGKCIFSLFFSFCWFNIYRTEHYRRRQTRSDKRDTGYFLFTPRLSFCFFFLFLTFKYMGKYEKTHWPPTLLSLHQTWPSISKHIFSPFFIIGEFIPFFESFFIVGCLCHLTAEMATSSVSNNRLRRQENTNTHTQNS